MKHANSLTIIAICFIGFVFTKCSKDNSTNPTQVRINVKDESGNNVPGAYVTFYERRPVFPSYVDSSDSNGNVLFTVYNLDHPSWAIVKGCMNNFNEPSQGDNIVLNTLNNFTTVIYETGVLRLDIIDTTSYSIASSVFTGVLSGTDIGTITYHFYPKAGAFNFHSEIYNVPGTGKDTTVQMACGDTTLIMLPY